MNVFVIGIYDPKEESLLTYQPSLADGGTGVDFFVGYTNEEMAEVLVNGKKNAEENGIDPSRVVLYQLVPVGVKLCECQ